MGSVVIKQFVFFRADNATMKLKISHLLIAKTRCPTKHNLIRNKPRLVSVFILNESLSQLGNR